MEKRNFDENKLNISLVNRWENAWQEPLFKQKLIVGMSIFVSLMPIFPFFFQYIQKRNGFHQNDVILQHLPAHDVSIPIFIITWFMAVLAIIRAVQDPTIFITFLYGFIILNISRFISILLIPCNPPADLIAITDPISNFFYGKSYVTKDLFYSGHTATQFLIFLCLRNRNEKILGIIATVLMGILVLVQHVHFTIDVIFAPLFTYISYYISVQILYSKRIVLIPMKRNL
ncbi:hypothetical protein [Rubrolithibacter danxiaensis]|uniref:hypothetical protein n=1 Tax=Rubrolithibacter danxiaensis TaxID=3390805 RepID=UPI003BF86474